MLNAAAARRGQVGDQITIVAYAWLADEEIASHKPKIVLLEDRNRYK